MRINLALIFLFLAFAGLPASEKKIKEYDVQIKSKSSELRKVENEIKLKRAARDEERKKEEIFKKGLRRIDSALSSLNMKHREIKSQIKKVQSALRSAKVSLETAKIYVLDRHSSLVKDINSLWILRSYWRVFSFKNRVFESADIMEQRMKLYRAACTKEQRCENMVNRWQSDRSELESLKSKLNENLTQQKTLKEEKKKMLMDATARRVAIEEEIKSLGETAKALHDLIARIESKKKKTKESILREEEARKKASKMIGTIPWPVKGEVVLKFGKNKREDIDTPVISNGIRIKTSSRSDVNAVADGECVFAGPFRGYGQMVVLDHRGAFYTVYGFLDEISVNNETKVKAGQKIGASNGDGIIYFEVRVDGQPVDPILWLEK